MNLRASQSDHTEIYKNVILDKWLLANGIDFFGLHETRQPARHINLANYTYTSGPADKGTEGTALLTRGERTRHIHVHEADAHQRHATVHYNTTTLPPTTSPSATLPTPLLHTPARTFGGSNFPTTSDATVMTIPLLS